MICGNTLPLTSHAVISVINVIHHNYRVYLRDVWFQQQYETNHEMIIIRMDTRSIMDIIPLSSSSTSNRDMNTSWLEQRDQLLESYLPYKPWIGAAGPAD
jgi:hypothetical protein